MNKEKTSSIIIVSLIIVLISVAVPLIYGLFLRLERGPATEEDKLAACASKIKMIHLTLRQYAMDYSDNFPPANGAAGLEYLRKLDYLTDYSTYICPSTKTVWGKNNQPLKEDIVDYVYIGGLTEKSDPKSPILYDKAGNHKDFGNVIVLDGTVKDIYEKPHTKKIKK